MCGSSLISPPQFPLKCMENHNALIVEQHFNFIFRSMQMLHIHRCGRRWVKTELSEKSLLFANRTAEKPTSTEIVREQLDQFVRRYAKGNIISTSSPLRPSIQCE